MKVLKWIQIDFMTFFYEIITVENVDNFLSSINLSIYLYNDLNKNMK